MRLSISSSLLVLADDQGADNAVSNAEDTIELQGEAGGGSKGHEDVVAVVLVVDGIGQTALAPLVNLGQSAVGLHQVLELGHESGGRLLAQVGVQNVDSLVVRAELCHVLCTSLWTYGPHISDEGKDELSVSNTNKLYYYIKNSGVVKKKMQKENSLRRAKISQLRDNIADNDEQMKNMQEEDRKKNAGVNVKDGDNANLSASNIDGTVSHGSSQSSDENLDGGSLNVDILTVSAQNVVDGIRISNLDGNITANNANGAGGGPMNMEQFGRMLNFQSLHEKNVKNKSMLEELELEDKKGQADYTATRRKAFARLGSTLAATAVGMGAADNIGDAAIVANAIDMPLDYISDKKIDSKTYKTAARKLNDEINTQTEALRKDLESKGYSEESIDRKVRITTRDKVDLKAEFDSKIITTPSIKNGAKMIKNAVNTVSEQGLRQTVSNIASSAKDKAGISTKYAAKLWSEHQKDKRYGQDLRMQRIQTKRKARSDKIRNIDNI